MNKMKQTHKATGLFLQKHRRFAHTEGLDKKAALQVIQKVLAADFSCEESDLVQKGTVICEVREKEVRGHAALKTKAAILSA